MTDPVKTMKQEVGRAAAARVQSDSIVGLGSGSTAAYAIEYIGDRLSKGEIKNIVGVPTSFQAEVLAKKFKIPLVTLDAIDHIDIAIDGADEVDPQKNLIKGGGAAHTREKVVDSLANEFIVVVDDGKLVDKLGSTFLLPVEVIPMAVAPVMRSLEKLGGKPELRMGVKKAGPVVTDQGNLVGCHANGGNIVRRGKNLKIKALHRNKVDTQAAIASIVTNGKGIMSAYGDKLTTEQIAEVSAYVLQRAEQNWQ